MTLYTVGYEGCDIEQFLAGLKEHEVTCVIDIRKNPVSRKKGFSKSRLKENLEAQKIEYVHIGALGVPSAWRKKQKAKLISRAKMFADYVEEIIPEQKNELTNILQIAGKTKKAALLCYEADACDCHRHFVTEEIKKMKRVKIIDLNVLPEEANLGMFGKPLKKNKKAA
ncbi:DUF488 family protein [Bdellovibrio sp. NC01]|uniref:DUF488 domain-containing protein n=1 Tax=Bdellovibrio sp. NC01 TaxID=2220073 RepID=UPI0011587E88|nr:DUF488 domain-containing protein [Bdellovibrio sp. NC01]QDK39307.1 DUF488 domain-containing protein [Bdellovibrio sp. NC01]